VTQVALLLALAAVGHGLAQWRRLPVAPILLLLGILLGAVSPLTDRDAIRQLVELGLAFLVFNAGIELSPRRFLHQTRAVLWVALGQFALVGFAGFTVAGWMGFGVVPALYLAFASAASSTLIVIRQLKAQQQMFQPFGRLVTGVLLLQDAIMIAVIVVLARLDAGAGAMAQGFGGLLALSAIAGAFHLWVLPWIERTLRPDEETLLLLALALLFLFLGAAFWLDLPVIAGAFLAGFTLSVFPVNGLIRGLLGSLAEFFHAFFFAALGSLVVFSSVWIPVQAVVFAAMVIVVTPGIVTLLAEWQGQASRNAIESGLLLAQTSELSLVLGLAGVAAGHLEMATFSVIALTCAITMMATPFLATDRVTWQLLHHHPGRRRNEGFAGFEQHALVIGLGSAGMWVVKALRKAGLRVLVIDDDASVIGQCERSRVASVRGDGTDPQVLARAGIEQARLVIVSLPRVVDVLKIIEQAGDVPVVARVFEAFEEASVRDAGGIPVSSSRAAFEKFLEWFDKTHEPRPDKAYDTV